MIYYLVVSPAQIHRRVFYRIKTVERNIFIMGKVRYRLMDTIKGLACMAVVLLHFGFPDPLGLIIRPLCSFAVPYFFFVSGFFCTNSKNTLIRSNTWRKIRHILRLIVISALVYAVFCVIWNQVLNSDWNIVKYTASLLTKDKIAKFFLTNDPFVYSHLWFLGALLYCYLTVLLFDKKKISPWIAIVAVLLWIGFIAFGELKYILPIPSSIPLFDTENRLYLFNCYLFRALPFFLFGMLTKLNAERIKKVFSKIPLVSFYSVIILGIGIALWERIHIGVVQFYMGTYLVLGSLCILSVTRPHMGNPLLEFIGQKLSLYVYIFHIMIGKIIDLTANKIRIPEGSGSKVLIKTGVYRYSRPFLILAVCFLVTLIIYKGVEFCKKRFCAGNMFQ